MKSKKALGVVIATSLFLVVAIVATIGFQAWFSNYSSQNQVKVEENSNEIDNGLKVAGIINDILYLNSPIKLNFTSLKIIDSSGSSLCSFSEDMDINSSGLVAWWTFNEIINDSGTLKILDYSGNENNGTLVDDNSSNADGDSPPKLVSSILGNALEFDGVDDYILLPDSIYMISEDISDLSIFIVANYYYFGDTEFPAILSNYHGPPETGLAMKIFEHQNSFQFRGSVSPTLYASLPEFNKRVTYFFTWNSSHSKLYKNLNLEDSSNLAYQYYNISDHFLIGKDYGSMGSDGIHLDGYIDEIRIYNRSLTDDEFNNLYWYSINSQSNSEIKRVDLTSCNLTEGETYEVVAFTPTSSIQQKVVAK